MNENTNKIILPLGTIGIILAGHYKSYPRTDYAALSLKESGYNLLGIADAIETPDLTGYILLVEELDDKTTKIIKRLPFEALYFPIHADFITDVSEWEYNEESCVVAMFNGVDKEHYSFLVDVTREQREEEKRAKESNTARLNRLCEEGHICTSCGTSMVSHSDFTHGCGKNICAMCS